MTAEPTNRELFDGARRARTLRWLLKLRTAHNLPMPQRIDFGQLDSTAGEGVLRYLLLELDRDTDVTGWAKAVNANHWEELLVDGQFGTFTNVSANTGWHLSGPRADWHKIEISSKHHYRPRTDRQAVTA